MERGGGEVSYEVVVEVPAAGWCWGGREDGGACREQTSLMRGDECPLPLLCLLGAQQ